MRRLVRRGFNWATACQPWEPRKPPTGRPQSARFNWATACQPWERANGRVGVYGGVPVSIGPRRVSRGNCIHDPHPVHPRVLVSIGPRRVSRGNPRNRRRPGCRATGFNWATACQPWEPIPADRPATWGEPCFNWATACQPWEHATAIKEGDSTLDGFNWATACQPWERRSPAGRCPRSEDVSIGPRRVSRGNAVTGEPVLNAKSGSFNWATACQPWEPMGPRRSKGDPAGSFNWATACQPWERGCAMSTTTAESAFQLGHGVSAVGTASRIVLQTWQHGVSIGPRRVSRGNPKSASCCAREVVSFNWATACQPWERQLSRMYAGGRRSRFQLGHGVSAVGTVGIGSSSRDTTYKGIFEQQVLRVKREKKSKGGAVATGCPAMT